MKISTLLERSGQRTVPSVHEDDSIDNVIQVMVRSPHVRYVYVVDDENRLIGTITLGSVLRHLFPHYYEAKIHGHGILRRITSETARDLMDRTFAHAALEDTVDQVLKKMAETGVKALAILDDNGRILAEVTAIDLLRYHHLKDRNDRQTDDPPETQ